MTNEQIAIRQHLSKPRPEAHACGCMGPSEITDLVHLKQWRIAFHDDPNTSKYQLAKVLAIFYQEKFAELLVRIKKNDFVFNSTSKMEQFRIELVNAGITNWKVKSVGSPVTPKCRCAMAWVEMVDGFYYEISEKRSPDGVTHTATYLGPVGGPYENSSCGW